MRTNRKSVLLKTSSAADVQCGGGLVAITGFGETVAKKDIISAQQIKYRAEVVQVVYIGETDFNPVADTEYTIAIGDPNRAGDGYQDNLYRYTYKTQTPITLDGADAAAQRETIYLALLAKVNGQTPLNRAVATSAGSGDGLIITDSAGYYPVKSQSQTKARGANVVIPCANPDGTGFAASNVRVATAAVYSFGVGAKLGQEVPVMDNIFGNMISGNLVDPPIATDGTGATSGQNYDAFQIVSLQKDNLPTIGDFYGYIVRTQTVYVDNGTGTATTNLAGFITFEAAMLDTLVYDTYRSDPSAQIDFFNNQIFFQGAAGAVPTATGANKMISLNSNGGVTGWTYTQIGSATATTPTPAVNGLNLDQDAADTEGAEYTPSLNTNCPVEYKVGKTPFQVNARIIATDWTDAAWLIGFRIKAAHAADFNNYTDLAAVGTLAASGDLITTQGILNNAATVSTSTGVIPADSASVTVAVLVDIAGRVTCKVNGATYPVYSTGTTPLVLDSGDLMIPFVRAVNVAAGDPDLILMRVASVASNEAIV